jgi:hypothetical protein
MGHEDQFSLESARRAGEEGRLPEWVGDFLSSPGSDNAVLAAALAERPRCWLGPLRVPLDRLVRLAGPEDADDVICPVDEDEWEQDVDEMHTALERGWEPPPLLVSVTDDELLLEDGNHRYETLRRAGASEAWAIVWCDDESDWERIQPTPSPLA